MSSATRLLATVLLCVLVPAAALAQGGVNFAWENCPAEGGGQNLDFACGSNAGSNAAVATFVLPANAPQVVGIYASVEIYGTGTLPAWWSLQSGGCRAGLINYSTDFTGAPFDAATQCYDVWQAQAIGGPDYKVSVGGDASHARFRMIAAVLGSQAKSLVAGREYYGFRMIVSNAGSTGAGSCDGCSTPAGLVLSLVQIAQPLGVGDFDLTAPIQQNAITWLGYCGLGLTPAARKTWGQVKRLYR